MNQTPLNVGHLSTAYHTAVLLIGTRWVEEHLGRTVKWTLLPTGPDLVNALERRDLDIAYIGLTPAMIGIGRGVPIRCVAGGHIEGTVVVGKSQYCTLDEYGGDVSAALGQFKGKAIGSPKRGSIHDIIVRYYLEEAGLQDEVEVKNFDSAEFIAEGMGEGVVDAACATPSILSYLGFFRDSFDTKVVVPPSRLWPYNPSYGVFARNDLVEEQPHVVEDFLAMHKRATEFMRDKPAEAARIVADVMELVDEAYVIQAYKVSPKYCIALPREYVDATLKFVEPIRRLGYLQRNLTAQDIFDLRFVQLLHPEPHHYLVQPVWS